MISLSYRVYESEVCGPEAGFQVQVTSSLRLGVRRGLARFLATLSRGPLSFCDPRVIAGGETRERTPRRRRLSDEHKGFILHLPSLAL